MVMAYNQNGATAARARVGRPRKSVKSESDLTPDQVRPMVPRQPRRPQDLPLAGLLHPDGGPTRRAHITEHHVDAQRARRKRLARDQAETHFCRRRERVEGAHGLEGRVASSRNGKL